jgi:hypothetical protein
MCTSPEIYIYYWCQERKKIKMCFLHSSWYFYTVVGKVTVTQLQSYKTSYLLFVVTSNVFRTF